MANLNRRSPIICGICNSPLTDYDKKTYKGLCEGCGYMAGPMWRRKSAAREWAEILALPLLIITALWWWLL